MSWMAALTPSLPTLVEVQPRQTGLDEQRHPQPFLPDWVGLPKPNRDSFGVSVPQIPALLAPGLVAHIQFGSFDANTPGGEHFLASQAPKMLSSRLQ